MAPKTANMYYLTQHSLLSVIWNGYTGLRDTIRMLFTFRRCHTLENVKLAGNPLQSENNNF